MKITILCENECGYSGALKCHAEWGLSLYIESAAGKILFDLGHTGIYAYNATRLEIDLQKVDYVVLSHHHCDHTGGLRFSPFQNPKNLILHPLVLSKLPKEELAMIESSFIVTPSSNPMEFAGGCFFLGEIPRVIPFETGVHKDDAMRDDSALAFSTDYGVVVISGCSHAGICNICEYAKAVTGLNLYAVVGGFHLVEGDDQLLQNTIAYFQKEKPTYLFPMHCVGFPALSQFHQKMGVIKKGTGDTIEMVE